MSKSKDKKQNKQNNQKPMQEMLNQDASLRLKAFIEDLRHDPMFRHRLFYPVLYKEITRKNEHVGSNGRVTASVADVSYEYYLLKMEKFDNDNAARIFQAILIANGPMLPEKERFKLAPADDSMSILNQRNKDEVIKRTRTLLTVLQDSNLYNFIFKNTVGKNLDSMRENFSKLVKNINIGNSGYKLQNKKIEQQLTVNWKNLKTSKSPMTTALDKNISYLANFFEHIKDKDISEVINFLIYMGKSRNVVTDFSYRPMSQNELEKYTSYDLSDEEEKELEYKTQLEQALNSNILQKDLNTQVDILIPLITKEYAAICANGDSALINMSQKNFVQSTSISTMPNEIKNALKVKLQRSLKRILDYTKNYLTRKIVTSDSTRNDTFIGKVVQSFYEELENSKLSVGEISRKVLDYDEFTSYKTDLATLIREIFKNDIAYIMELCRDYKSKSNTKNKFINSWDESNKNKSEKLEENILKELSDVLKSIELCYEVTDENKNYNDLYKYITKYSENSVKPINIDNLSSKIAATIQADINKKLSSSITDYTVAERIARRLFSDLGTVMSFISKLLIKNSYNNTLANMLTVAEAYKLLMQYIESYSQTIKQSPDYKDVLGSLREFYIIFFALSNMITHLISHTDLNEFNKLGLKSLRYKIENIFSKIDKCNSNASDILDILKDYEKLTPEDFLKKLIVAKTKSENKVEKFNVDPLAEHLLSVYFKYYLKPVLVNFFGYALDEFNYTSRKNEIESDVISKDKLHFSTLLKPENVGVFTIDGAVFQDLAKFTYVLMSDTYSGITYTSPDSVMRFLNNVYGLKFFNVIIYGANDAYVYMNNVGVPYLYRGAKTKIPIRELRRNYEFLMDPSRGLYKNISLPKKK